MDENNKNLFYTWSNVDGDIRVFESWSELIEKEDWEYLENYHDSLDYIEVGKLIPIAPRGDPKEKYITKITMVIFSSITTKLRKQTYHSSTMEKPS